MKLNNKRLIELRKEKGITQTTMSKDLNLQQGNLSRYERGSIENPSAAVVKAIANYLECNMEDLLLTGKEDSQTIPNRIDVHVHFHWGE
jgi:transcriptional regulator with XRE-family HTH domain